MIPRFTSIFQNLASQKNPTKAPGTLGAAMNDWMKSPILGGLPKGGLQGLYKTSPGKMNLYKSKNPLTDEQFAKMKAEAEAKMAQGGMPQPVQASIDPTRVITQGPGSLMPKQSSTAAAPLVGGNKFFSPQG